MRLNIFCSSCYSRKCKTLVLGFKNNQERFTYGRMLRQTRSSLRVLAVETELAKNTDLDSFINYFVLKKARKGTVKLNLYFSNYKIKSKRKYWYNTETLQIAQPNECKKNKDPIEFFCSGILSGGSLVFIFKYSFFEFQFSSC